MFKNGRLLNRWCSLPQPVRSTDALPDGDSAQDPWSKMGEAASTDAGRPVEELRDAGPLHRPPGGGPGHGGQILPGERRVTVKLPALKRIVHILSTYEWWSPARLTYCMVIASDEWPSHFCRTLTGTPWRMQWRP